MRNLILHRTIELANGVAVSEHWWANGGPRHRRQADGPAIVHRDPRTGAIMAEVYFELGKRHRDNGPAVIERNADGAVLREAYCLNGVLHRDPEDGPALIERNADHPDQIEKVEYRLFGQPYRRPEAGPWHVSYNETGKVEKEAFCASDVKAPTGPLAGAVAATSALIPIPFISKASLRMDVLGHGRAQHAIDLKTGLVTEQRYYFAGKLHSPEEEGPAVHMRKSDGELWYEVFCKHGKKHREAGPAVRWHGRKGGVRFEEYYREDRLHRDPSEGPAKIAWRWDDGTLGSHAYYLDGKLHRDPQAGPALIEYDIHERYVTLIEYRVRGNPSRDPEAGPWRTVYSDDRVVESEEFCDKAKACTSSRPAPVQQIAPAGTQQPPLSAVAPPVLASREPVDVPAEPVAAMAKADVSPAKTNMTTSYRLCALWTAVYRAVIPPNRANNGPLRVFRRGQNASRHQR